VISSSGRSRPPTATIRICLASSISCRYRVRLAQSLDSKSIALAEQNNAVGGGGGIGSEATPRFSLRADRASDADALLREFPDLLDPVRREPLQRGGIWLVRPDGYVCVAGGADRVSSGRTFLRTSLQRNSAEGVSVHKPVV
jgi:hypothetical protein